VKRLLIASAFALGPLWAFAPGAAVADQVALSPGCNNEVLSWPAGTPVATVAAAIQPAGALESIWRFDNAAGGWLAYTPAPGAPNSYTATVGTLDTVFLCVSQAATLDRPD